VSEIFFVSGSCVLPVWLTENIISAYTISDMIPKISE